MGSEMGVRDHPIYLGSAWWPALIMAGILGYMVLNWPFDPLASDLAPFVLGVISMHLAVAVTEWTAVSTTETGRSEGADRDD